MGQTGTSSSGSTASGTGSAADARYDGIFKTCMNCGVRMKWLEYCECMRNLLHKKSASAGRITAAEGMVGAAKVAAKKEKKSESSGDTAPSQAGLF